jgi:two-component system response regulator VanR
MTQKLLLFKDKSILIAEDDVITREKIVFVLKMFFGKVYSAQNGEVAYEIYRNESPDIILCDVNMPKKDGIALIEQIRQDNYNIPVILISSFMEKNLLNDAANLSIDGYLVKPVNLDKLTSTIDKAMQRAHTNEGMLLLGKELYYNSATKELYHNGVVVELGNKEHNLLILLINNMHKTVSKLEIEQKLWPLDPISDSTLKKLIFRLRKKLGIDIIITVKGIGYRLDPLDEYNH